MRHTIKRSAVNSDFRSSTCPYHPTCPYIGTSADGAKCAIPCHVAGRQHCELSRRGTLQRAPTRYAHRQWNVPQWCPMSDHATCPYIGTSPYVGTSPDGVPNAPTAELPGGVCSSTRSSVITPQPSKVPPHRLSESRRKSISAVAHHTGVAGGAPGHSPAAGVGGSKPQTGGMWKVA